ncbi:thermonuclease family protein [Candidatus Saccharibacteria bacterium]|nr:thermonuclease family protein [Candidatus Saccharibacteria bacterium]MCB9834969.1 thermonuclease family protein [Candidatus Nomurabacteria bacterium]
MRKLARVLLGLVVLIGFVWFKNQSSLSSQQVTVLKVIDGDTIEVSLNGREQRVRLIGVDTPETKDPRLVVQCFGTEASQYSKNKLEGKQITLESDPYVAHYDKYQRLLAYVYLDGKNFNQELIEQGYAHEYTYDNQLYLYQADFKLSEELARFKNQGFWNEQTCGGNTKQPA